MTIPGLTTGNIVTDNMTDSEAVRRMMENLMRIMSEFRESDMRRKLKDCLDILVNEYEVVTLDLNDFWPKYVLWMIDSFTKFIQGKVISHKKADMIITTLTDSWCMNVSFLSRGFFADNGSKFTNIKLEELTSKLGLSVKFGPSYSPWINGLNE